MVCLSRMPKLLTLADDEVFELDALAEAQVDNTTAMLRYATLIFADGIVDEQDEIHVRRFRDHARLEHRMNELQVTKCGRMRRRLNQVRDLFTELYRQLRMVKNVMTQGV